MLVEVDVFSGRPNPRWELNAPWREELQRLQSRLLVSSQAPLEPPALGYRGFRYSDADGPVQVYRGFVRTTRAVLNDPAHTIERYLLDLIPADLLALRSRIAAIIGPAT